MKIYDFTSRERETGRVVFALTLIKTRKRLAERIIIGRENEVRLILNGGDGNVYYDEVRPIGSFLFNFEADPNGEWNSRIGILCESYNIQYSFGSRRWDKVAPVVEFLTAKYNSGEPSAVFAAVRTWEEYLNLYKQNEAKQTLNRHLFMLYKPFLDYAKYRPWQKEAVDALSIALRNGESQVELWYPVAKRTYEAVVVFFSLLPVISYYLKKMEDWKLVFQQCKVCCKDFVAPSRHYALCSDKCRKQQAVIAKREFNERIKDDASESLYDTAYQYWYNRWRKIRKEEVVNPDAVTTFKVEFDNFCKEAIKRKKTVKTTIKDIEKTETNDSKKEKAIKKILAEFNGWLLHQQGVADNLMDDFTSKAD